MKKTDESQVSEYGNGKAGNGEVKSSLCSHSLWGLGGAASHSDDDRVVFVPAEELRAIESIYCKMTQARQEFGKMEEAIKETINN